MGNCWGRTGWGGVGCGGMGCEGAGWVGWLVKPLELLLPKVFNEFWELKLSEIEFVGVIITIGGGTGVDDALLLGN